MSTYTFNLTRLLPSLSCYNPWSTDKADDITKATKVAEPTSKIKAEALMQIHQTMKNTH